MEGTFCDANVTNNSQETSKDASKRRPGNSASVPLGPFLPDAPCNTGEWIAWDYLCSKEFVTGAQHIDGACRSSLWLNLLSGCVVICEHERSFNYN